MTIKIMVCVQRKKKKKFCFSIWNISVENEHFKVLESFVETVLTTRYDNLDRFEHFLNLSDDFSFVDMLNVSFEVIQFRKLEPASVSSIFFLIYLQLQGKLNNHPYRTVITELGVCFSSTNLYYYQSPYQSAKYENCN